MLVRTPVLHLRPCYGRIQKAHILVGKTKFGIVLQRPFDERPGVGQVARPKVITAEFSVGFSQTESTYREGLLVDLGRVLEPPSWHGELVYIFLEVLLDLRKISENLLECFFLFSSLLQ